MTSEFDPSLKVSNPIFVDHTPQLHTEMELLVTLELTADEKA
jgi:hypothetical protein